MLVPFISKFQAETVAAVRAALPSSVFDAAWAKGKAMSIGEAAALALVDHPHLLH